MREIYSYTDYRRYLEDFYKDQKEIRPSFSYQLFAEKSGFVANSYLIDIIKGRKDLSKKSILAVAKAMKLKRRKVDYFEILVVFTQAKTVDEKEYFFEKLKSYRSKSDYKYLEVSQYNYFSKWYNVVIRELITMKGIKADPVEIAKRVKPNITPKQAKDSLALLLKLNLVKKLLFWKLKRQMK